jgi:6-phosphogluconolactonase
MNLRIFDSTHDLIHATARTIVQQIEALETPVIALSGGATPIPLYELLGGPTYRHELAKRAVTWVVVDERYVPLDDPQSNAAMIQRTLFADGMLPTHRFLRFKTELNDPAKTAAWFADEWHFYGIEKIDLVLLGIGDDGHTASLFPGTPVLDVEDRVAAEVFVPKLEQWRVTITKPVIRAAALRLVLVAGASKARIIREVREGVDHPLALVTRGVETWWLVDRAAATEDV